MINRLSNSLIDRLVLLIFSLSFFCLFITFLSVLLTFSFHRLMENGSLDFETSMKKLQGILNLVFFQPPSLPKTSPPWEQTSLCIIEAI